jgi:nucleoside-diphosphate-sugar epimerase
MKPPRTIVSGGTGFVGRFIVERLLAEGHEVTVAGRNKPADGFFSTPARFAPLELGADVDTGLFAGTDFFVHCAFNHLPGRYRGGEGDDPEGFCRRNLDGSLTLFRAAKAAGVKRAVFLSSRAVYGEQPPGAELTEDTAPKPNSLYGEVKLACEQGLAAMADETFCAVSLHVTGVYGPTGAAGEDKYAGMIADYLAGRPVASRTGTEVHGEDVAWAVLIALTAPLDTAYEVFNVSDIVVDNADVLAIIKEATSSPHPLPPRADAAALNAMSTAKLRGLGWRPGGRDLFEETLRTMAEDYVSG